MTHRHADTAAGDEPAAILVVDDDREIRTLLTQSLGARGGAGP